MILRAKKILFAVLLPLLALSAGGRARADVAVMIPVAVREEADNEQLEQASDELTRLLKLKGFDVISAGQAAPAAEAEQERGAFSSTYDPLDCVTPECANEYRKLFDATFAVQLRLETEGTRLSSATVLLTEAPDVFFRATARVQGRDVRSAVRVAFEAARAKQEDGAGPWLDVEGSPLGARVHVDGFEVGMIPFTKRHIDPGAHQVEIYAEGHRREVRTIQVPSDIEHVEQIAVSLTPLMTTTPIAAPTTPRPRWWRKPSWPDWVLAGGLLAGGAVHLGAGVLQKTKQGECAEQEGGRCVSYFGDTSGVSRENVLIGVGAAGLALGAAVIGLSPIDRFVLRPSEGRALLEYRRTF